MTLSAARVIVSVEPFTVCWLADTGGIVLWVAAELTGILIEVSGAREGHAGDGDENTADCGGRVFARIDGNL